MRNRCAFMFAVLAVLTAQSCKTVALDDSDGTPVKQPTPSDTATVYTCAGKTQCSQMSSCAEATYYLENCPGSVTDGDGDGLPCEDQFCGH